MQEQEKRDEDVASTFGRGVLIPSGHKKTDPRCESVLKLVGDEGFEPPTLSV